LQGKIPLVAYAESADVIATLLVLKKEVEAHAGNPMRLTIVAASEAHLLAKEIGEAGVGVIVRQQDSFVNWEMNRRLPGPPLTQSTAVATLVAHNVTVGLQVANPSDVRITRFNMDWVSTFSAAFFIANPLI
jgi:hypothetical protein